VSHDATEQMALREMPPQLRAVMIAESFQIASWRFHSGATIGEATRETAPPRRTETRAAVLWESHDAGRADGGERHACCYVAPRRWR
jgi:hypothetical protein